MNDDWPVLRVSVGDMALAMTGVKTRHIAAIKPPARLIDRAMLECELNGKILRYPVFLDRLGPIDHRQPLLPSELASYGYCLPTQKNPPLNTDKPLNEGSYLSSRATNAAMLFLNQKPRYVPAESYTALSIAGKHAKKRWLADVQFHLPGPDDALSRKQRKEVRAMAAIAENALLNELLATRSFITNDIVGAKRWGIATKDSMQRAVLVLQSQDITNIDSITDAFKQSYAPLRGARHQPASATHTPHVSFPDGKGASQLLAASESADISVGTACQLYMKTVRHALLKRQPKAAKEAAQARASGTNYFQPQTVRLSAQSRSSWRRRVDHHIDLPMNLEIAEERVIEFSHMNNAMAHEFGFATTEDLRKELGLRKGESCTLYAYPVKLAPKEQLPFDQDRAGSRVNGYRRELWDAWSTGSERTVKRAKRHHSTLSEKQQRAGFVRLADQLDMNTEEAKPLMNSKGTRLVPNDVRVVRQNEEPSSRSVQRPTAKSKRMPTPPDPANGAAYRKRGEGWNVSAPGSAAAPATTSLSNFMPREILPPGQPPAIQEPASPTRKKTPAQIAEERRMTKREREQARRAKEQTREASWQEKTGSSYPEPPPTHFSFRDGQAYVDDKPEPAHPHPSQRFISNLRQHEHSVDSLAKRFDEEFHKRRKDRER